MSLIRKIRVVIVAGGTGGHAVRQALFGREDNMDITHLVGTWDSGGGSGRLMKYGQIDLPPGDVAQGLIAASLWPEEAKAMLRQRDEDGQTTINRIIAAFRKQTNSFSEAVIQTNRLLNCQGVVITVTEHRTQLEASVESGRILFDEDQIDEYHGPINESHLFTRSKGDDPLQSEPEANPAALKALAEADIIVIGPGSLRTSIQPNFLISEIRQAVYDSSAKIIGIANLANDGHTPGWTARRYGDEFCQFIGRPIDYLIANSGTVPQWVVDLYQEGDQRGRQDIVELGQPNPDWHYQLFGYDFVSDMAERPASNAGGVQRSLLRHSPHDLQSALLRVFSRLGYNRLW